MLPRRYPSVELRPTRVGLGVFAQKPVPRGLIIGDVWGTIINDDLHGSAYCMELGPGRALEPQGVFRFLNHSCEPNCELFFQASSNQKDIPDRLWLKALRGIAAGEELTIDYAWPSERAIPCLCGAPACRGWIVAAEEMTNAEARMTNE
jgi:hypothetical protein